MTLSTDVILLIMMGGDDIIHSMGLLVPAAPVFVSLHNW